jgi:hypothetical protein
MLPFRTVAIQLRRIGSIAVVCALCAGSVGAGKGAITKLTLDPEAPVIDVFSGMDNGQIAVRVSAENAREGRIFLTNKTDRPLTVALPKALIAAQVLPQFNQPGGGLFGNNQMGLNNGANGANGANGLAQMVGGNAMPAGPGNGFPNPGGQMNNGFAPNNFFSIPPEKTVQLNLQSVCLNYGRPEPHSGLTYRLVKVESVTTDPVLRQLLENYSPRTNRDAQQAAAWHLANGLTWEQIVNLTTQPAPGIAVPLFDAAQVQQARDLISQARKDAAERPIKPVAPVTTAALRD